MLFIGKPMARSKRVYMKKYPQKSRHGLGLSIYEIKPTFIYIHPYKTTFMCPRSIVGVPFDSCQNFTSPYFFAPLVCVLNFSGGQVVWRFYKQTNKQKISVSRWSTHELSLDQVWLFTMCMCPGVIDVWDAKPSSSPNPVCLESVRIGYCSPSRPRAISYAMKLKSQKVVNG